VDGVRQVDAGERLPNPASSTFLAGDTAPAKRRALSGSFPPTFIGHVLALPAMLFNQVTCFLGCPITSLLA
jgi:hypothetical protein